jgi:hypothetical protein
LNQFLRAQRGAVQAVAVLGCLGALACGCGTRPAVRLLVDDRIQQPVEEARNLYEMRTGQRVRATFASARRLETLLFTGSHDMVLGDHAQLASHPVTSAFDPGTERMLGTSDAGVTFGCMLRRSSLSRPEPRGLWQFFQQEEARAILEAAGIRPAAAQAPAPQGDHPR